MTVLAMKCHTEVTLAHFRDLNWECGHFLSVSLVSYFPQSAAFQESLKVTGDMERKRTSDLHQIKAGLGPDPQKD